MSTIGNNSRKYTKIKKSFFSTCTKIIHCTNLIILTPLRDSLKRARKEINDKHNTNAEVILRMKNQEIEKG